MLRAKGSGPSQAPWRPARRAEPYALGTQRLARRAEGFELRAPCEGPRASGHGQREKGEGPSARRFAPRSQRFAPSAESDEPSAQRQVRRAQSEVLRAENRGSHPADLGFENRCVTPIESTGEGFAVPLGVRAARSTRDGFSSPRGGRGGVTPSPKNKSQSPASSRPRGRAGRWLRSGYPRLVRAG